MSRRLHSRAAGFTLLEIMLAITILAVVMVMIASSFSAVAHSKIQGESHLYADREGRAILWQISREVRGAVQTPFAQSQVALAGKGQMRSGAPVDSLIVSTLSPGHRRSVQGFGAEDLVAYSTSPNPRHPGWSILTRTQGSALLTVGSAALAPVVLADNVISLHLRYSDGTRWLESWDSRSLQVGQQLPLAISIDLQLATGNGGLMNFSTVVPLPMAVPQW